MFNISSNLYKKPWLIIFDIILLNLALTLSFYLRFDGNWLYYFSYSYLAAVSIIGAGVLYFSNLYNKMWKYASIAELNSIIKTSALINLLLIFYIYFTILSFPRSIIIINGVLDIFFLGGLRFSLRFFKDHLNKGRPTGVEGNVLVVGAGDAAEITLREMQKHSEFRKKVVGLIDDDPEKLNMEIHGKKVLGDRYAIPTVIRRYSVDEIIIAIPSAAGKDVKEIYDLSNQKGVKVKILPGVYEIINGDVNLSQIRDVQVEDLLRRDQVNLNTDEISAYLQNKCVLVTGAGGSIGAELCRQIARFNPEKLIMLDIYENNLYFLQLELNEQHKALDILPVIGSIQDLDKLHNVFDVHQPDVVFHAAAHKHVPLMEHNPEEAVKNNITGTKNVAEAADEFDIDRFVLISTDKAVNPTNVMGASKRAAEMIIQSINKRSNTKYMAVRFGNVLGSHGSVIPLFKKQIARGGPLTVTHPEVTRYFMTIPEASQLVVQAGGLGNGGEVFVLDMGEPVKIIDLAKNLIKLSGLKPGEDIEIEITGLRPGEKLFEELLNDSEDNIETEHERIFITKLNGVNNQMLDDSLTELERVVRIGDRAELIDLLVELVGTYRPGRDNKYTEQLQEVAATREG